MLPNENIIIRNITPKSILIFKFRNNTCAGINFSLFVLHIIS